VAALTASELAERGYTVDLVVSNLKGDAFEVSPKVRIIDLNARSQLRSLPRFIRYLGANKPRVILSEISQTNIVAILAQSVALRRSRLVTRDHTVLKPYFGSFKGPKQILIPWLVRRLYPRAQAVIAVSDSIRRELIDDFGICAEAVTTVHNLVATGKIRQLAGEEVDNPWFADPKVPVILCVARLHPVKGQRVLLAAFAKLRRRRLVRLMLLGEGPDREMLGAYARELALGSDVAMPGFLANPFAVMARSAVLALPSYREGFGNVLVEAMACGCQVVATDCPGGPSEILDGGRYGRLTPVGDADALAEALEAAIDFPLPADALRRRAEMFTAEAIIPRIEALLFPPARVTPQAGL
jgi:glycosyltransferase involved in cell wall biosynthesis